jgi:hypothetical protein
MKVIRIAALIVAMTLAVAGCSVFPPDFVGDPLPEAVELPSVPEGAHVELAAETDEATFFIVNEGQPTMCIVEYRSDRDWHAGCGGPSLTMGGRGQTIAWFEHEAPTDEWSQLGGGLWVKR